MNNLGRRVHRLSINSIGSFDFPSHSSSSNVRLTFMDLLYNIFFWLFKLDFLIYQNFSILTSLDMGGNKRPPDFQNSSKKIFHIDCEWLKSRDSKTSELRCLSYFCHISDIDFFPKSRVFSAFLCRKFNFFMIKSEIFRVLLHPSFCGAVDKVLGCR